MSNYPNFKKTIRCQECGLIIEFYTSRFVKYHPKCYKVVVARRNHLKNMMRAQAKREARALLPKKVIPPKPPKPEFVPMTEEEWLASKEYKKALDRVKNSQG